MSLQVFANNASSLLASGILATDLTVTVTAGQGALYPVISAGQYAIGTLEDTSGNIEIVKVTGRTTDTMTIVRAQESTTAQPFASGSRFEVRPTAGIAALFLQKTGSDTLSGSTNFTGILVSTGSIQGGEIAGTKVRGSPGETDNELAVPIGGGPATVGGSPILTVANIFNQLNGTGKQLVIAGMVLFWSGTSGSIPTGYTLCDGTAGTPDLRDQFILCGGGALPTTGGTSTTITGSSSIGALTVAPTALTVNQLPKHTHTVITSLDTLNGAGVGFALSGVNGSTKFGSGSLTHSDTGGHTEDSGGPTGTMNGDTHTHTLSGSSAHTHTYSLPPYRALFAIMKT